MDRLVKQLITPFITEQVKATRVIAVYPGRFQPFGPHQKKVYDNLKKKFGEVYITTSNIKSPPRHPMDFREKVRHMVKMGIPKNKTFIMPAGDTRETLVKMYPLVFELCAKHGYNMTGRDHIIAFNTERGV